MGTRLSTKLSTYTYFLLRLLWMVFSLQRLINQPIEQTQIPGED
jgi:hypothetical protein